MFKMCHGGNRNREHFCTVAERHTFKLLVNSSPLIETTFLFYLIDANFLCHLSHLNDQHFCFSRCSNTNIQQKQGLLNARHHIKLSLSCEKGAKQNKRKRMNITKHDSKLVVVLGGGFPLLSLLLKVNSAYNVLKQRCCIPVRKLCLRLLLWKELCSADALAR